MPNVNCYLAPHLHNRRSELPPDVTLSGILNKGLSEHFAEVDAQKAKRKRKKSEAA